MDDRFLWLEDVTGDAALAWVKAQNALTEAALDDPLLRELEARLLAVYSSTARIPHVTRRGDRYFNFWQDQEHPRGLWRYTTWSEYLREEPTWTVLLDVDALGAQEGVSWVYKSAQVLRPTFDRGLLTLSRGGADAAVVREFDLERRAFVDGGFRVEEAKTAVSWIDRDRLFVASDFGPGTTTDSGYPRQIREWRRGTDLAQAPIVFEAPQTDVSAFASHDDTPGFARDFVGRAVTFFTNELHERTPEGLVRVDKPDDAEATVWREWLLVHLRSAWTLDGVEHASGSLLAAPYEAWKAGQRAVQVLFAPTPTTSLESYAATRRFLLLTVLDDVKSRIDVLDPANGWARSALPGVFGSASVGAVDAYDSDEYWLTSEDYVTPSTLARGAVGGPAAVVVKRLPALYDASGLAVTQHFVTSDDGTRVPYFQIGRPGTTGPTLLTGYGGFEISMRPFYGGGIGSAWLERGGTLAVANIRGGGEYGPRWHQAALREKRPRAYEDFAAVASDLVRRGVTTPAQLGAMGGSNGGLLMGNMITRFPERFGAIVVQVPLLDMQRYHRLLAGASWMAEYGDPDDPAQWAWLQGHSPYHQVRPDGRYPRTLFVTSTRDDRVHPGHARKMAAKMLDLGHDVLYWENLEGGHGAAADHRQKARLDALTYRFLWRVLGG